MIETIEVILTTNYQLTVDNFKN